MNQTSYPKYPTNNGYMTDTIRAQYIATAIDNELLPEDTHQVAHLMSLDASNDVSRPIQFWQLYSVLGQARIVALVQAFYTRVFDDEDWFSSVFSRIAGIHHHVNTQAAMWIDVMGGGQYYHGGEYRLSFHHLHNAMALMNDRGAQRWVKLMVETLNDPNLDLTDDDRVRPAINTFLAHFMDKYAAEFDFTGDHMFGQLNSPVHGKINIFHTTSDAIDTLSQQDGNATGIQDHEIDIGFIQRTPSTLGR